MGRLSGLFVYPVKSCAGIALDEGEVDDFGFRWDRRWMVVNEAGLFLSQRKHPRLALVRTRIADGVLTLVAPGMSELAVPLQPLEHARAGNGSDHGAPQGGQTQGLVAGTIPLNSDHGRACLRVRVWGDTVDALSTGRRADAWVSAYLGATCRLVYMPPSTRRALPGRWGAAGGRVGFADAYPFLLIGQASLDDLNRRLAQPLPMNRFRPNLVVDGAAPYAEDGWRVVRIGGIRFDVARECLRCVTTTIDQATARAGKEPLATLARYRRAGGTSAVAFGQNLVHGGRGVLRVGDAVEVEEPA